MKTQIINSGQNWIYSAKFDGFFIIAPAFIITFAALLFADKLDALSQVSPLWFGLLIVGIDVSHVYSTIFRTYCDKDELRARKTLYTLTPLLCWFCGTLLYAAGDLIFWRAITYLAVFHFVRQQYGFMMIYGRRDIITTNFQKTLDKAAIYIATIYPLIYWHTNLPRNFDWFVEGDFVAIPYQFINIAGLCLYITIIALYIGKEAYLSLKTGNFNIAKNLLLLGTGLSWWVGIVYFNNDLAFTAINVVAHGIPYIALIWIYGHNQSKLSPRKLMLGRITWQKFFSTKYLGLFLGVILALAWFEEGLWDALVWSEHKNFFRALHALPNIDDKATLTWLIPLLALPQTTHYVLDAFIWRMHTKGTNWKHILFYKATT
ncbi:MAG: hypothetical protein WCL30_02565 [Pseudomonadota bacterium]